MRKYLIAFLVSLATMILLYIVSKTFEFKISDFMVGWMSCMSFFYIIKELEEDKVKEDDGEQRRIV